MADNILESYLVKLGASVDANSFNKFNSTLKDSAKVFGDFSFNTIANFGKMEVAIVGMFGAVGAGIIGLADKTAMADQSYRLMGLRMLMGKDSARAMSMATDELGASLDEIAYDPELNRRFQALYEQNIKLGKSLGTGVDASMIGIRDLRMEYKMFETELQFLTIGAVSKLFEKIGFGSGDALNRLDQLNSWFSTNIPHMADEVATELLPVWKDFVVVTQDVGSVLKTAAGDFTFLTGVLVGDKSIETTEFNFKNIAKAGMDWIDVLADIALSLQLVGKEALHMTTAVGSGFGAVKAMFKGDWKEVDRLTGIQSKELNAAVENIQSLFDPGKNGKYIRANSDFSGIVAHEDEKSSRGNVAASPAAPPTQGGGSTAATAARLAQKVSADTGVAPDLVFAEWMFETGKFTNRGAKDLNNLSGIRIPGTTEYRKYKSLDDFAADYEKVIESSRYTSKGINQAKTPEGFAHSLKAGGYFEGPEADYAAGIRKYQPSFHDYAQSGSKGAGDVTIQSMVINVPPTASHPDDIKRYITDSMVDYTAKVNQRTMSETAAGAYF